MRQIRMWADAQTIMRKPCSVVTRRRWWKLDQCRAATGRGDRLQDSRDLPARRSAITGERRDVSRPATVSPRHAKWPEPIGIPVLEACAPQGGCDGTGPC